MANSQVTVRDTQLEKQRLGFMSLSLTNFANTSEPQIASGSVVEVGGSLYSFTSAESITGWSGISNDTDAYIKLTPGTSSVSASFVTSAPTWSAAKQGWYSGDDRYIGGLHRGASSSDYEGKYLYQHFNANSEAHLFYADGSIDIANSNFTIDSDGNAIFSGSLLVAYGMQHHSLLSSVAQQESGVNGITFSTDGTNFYEIASLNGDAHQSTLSTAWELSTATYSQTASLKNKVPHSIKFKSDGTKMYTTTFDDNKINEYPLSTAWDISTLGSVTEISAQDAAVQGVAWKTDGTKMYEIGVDSNAVYEYNVSTAWDITSATFSQSASLTGAPIDINWKSDGTVLYIGDNDNDAFTEYTLSTAWDVSTLSKRRSIDSPSTTPSAFSWGKSGQRVYAYNNGDSQIEEFYPL